MNAEDFRTAMIHAGLGYDGPIHPDGRLHRFKAHGDKARNSWYLLHNGAVPAGAFGCWKRCFTEKWHGTSRRYNTQEWQQVRERWEKAKASQEETEAQRRDRARKTALRILAHATEPQANHPYLVAKRVQPHGELRQLDDRLVLPLRDADGVLHSIQTIAGNGDKLFLPGGRIKGCFFALTDTTDGPLVICEGYATGASIHEATGYAVICAMNCGSLMDVAKALRKKFPVRKIVIAADDDRHTPGNPGLTKATEAAHAIGGKLAIPQF